MRILVHIDRLVLDGIALRRGSVTQIGAAVEREMTRLAGERDTTRLRGGALDSIEGPTIRLASEDHPERLGLRVAGSVHAALQGAMR